MLNLIFSKLKSFIIKMNEYGVPIPLFRLNGVATLTGTMSIISFTLAILFSIGKVINIIGPTDTSQINYIFLMSLGAYLGRRMQGNSSTKVINVEQEEKK